MYVNELTTLEKSIIEHLSAHLRLQQLAVTPCLPFLRQRSPDVTTSATEAADIQLQLTTHLSTRKDERLSWPSWLTYSGWFTHISGHPSATGRSQDSESTPAKDGCSTAGPRNQLSRSCQGHEDKVRGHRRKMLLKRSVRHRVRAF